MSERPDARCVPPQGGRNSLSRALIQMPNHEKYLIEFGCEPASSLVEFLANDTIRTSMPATFLLPNAQFNLEIQYLLKLEDPGNYRLVDRRFAFAVTTDGHDLLVGVDDPALEVFQDEFGDIDTLGVYVSDLAVAKRSRLG